MSGTIQPASGAAVTSTTSVTTALTFPPNAVSEPVTTTFAITDGYSAPNDFSFLGQTFSIEAHTSGGAPVTEFSEPFTITIHYDDNDLPANVAEADLKLYYWNDTLPGWEVITSTVDSVANTLTAVLNHLTTFAAIGETSSPPVYMPLILKN